MQASSSWQPGEDHYVLPTLVVLRSTNSREIERLQLGVEGRLFRLVEGRLCRLAEIGALRWVNWSESSQEESLVAAVEDACALLLQDDLWQRMVKKGYQRHQPADPSFTRVQVIVVWDGSTATLEDSTAALEDVLKVKQKLEERAEILPVLIWLGEQPEPPLGSLQDYWPRIRLDTITTGGTEVEPKWLYQACQHLLVALVATELTRAIEHVVQGEREKVEWLVLGASALVADLPRMRSWLREATLKRVLKPLVAAPFTDVDRHRIEKLVEKRAMKFRRALLEEASDALREAQWQMDIAAKDVEEPEDTLAVQRCVLIERELRETAFGQYQGGVPSGGSSQRSPLRSLPSLIFALGDPSTPEPDLTKKLVDHYGELADLLEQWLSVNGWRGLAPKAQEELTSLRAFLGAFLDRGLIPAEGVPVLQVAEEDESPEGLEAAIHAVESMTRRMAKEGDVRDARDQKEDQWMSPFFVSLGTKRHRQVAAEIDTDMVEGYIRRYHHFERTLASPLGVFLHLLPAFPLATHLLNLLLRSLKPEWKIEHSLLICGIALVSIGAAELSHLWLVRARQLLNEVQWRSHRSLADRVLERVAHAIRDYRVWVLHQLRETESLLQNLYDLLLERYQEAERVSWTIGESYARGSLYHLLDPKEVLYWAERASENVHRSEQLIASQEEEDDDNTQEHDSAVTAFVGKEFWPLPECPTPAQTILERIVEVCDQETEMRLKSKVLAEVLTASVIARKNDDLKEGQRWSWMWRQAQPLGMADSSHTFTMILVPDRYVSGSTGKESLHWQEEWMEAYTRQIYEEICIRGIVEWKRGDD